MMLFCRLLILTLLVGSGGQSVMAQDRPDRPWSRGGLAPSAEIRIEAMDLVAAMKLDCNLGMAVLRGNDSEGVRQYEVSCTNGPGYLLIGGEKPIFYACLALEASFRSTGVKAARCNISVNRNARPVVA